MRQLFLLITAASLLDLGCAGCDDGSQSPRPTADAAGADSTSPDAGSGSAGWTQKGGTLSMEPEGWAYSPSVAGRSDGTLFAVWSQHRKADVLEKVSPYASSYTNGQWQALGGRIGHDGKEGYDPSIVLLGNTPYVIWYEGQGFGWDNVGNTFFGSSVFVAHWDGASWVGDDNAAMANGSLHTAPSVTLSGTVWTVFARSPRLAVSGGQVYGGWIESLGAWDPTSNTAVVKHLDGGKWIQDGAPVNSGAPGGKILDVEIADVGGTLHLAWSEQTRAGSATGSTNSPALVRVVKLSGGAWVPVGSPLNVSTDNYAGYLSLGALGPTPYIAWQERAPDGPNRIFVKHWDGSAWAAEGGVLNADPVHGEAGRPTVTDDGSRVWVAWTEGGPAQPSQLYVTSSDGAAWRPLEGSLNIDPTAGSAEKPVLTVAAGVPQVVWGEFDARSSTGQIYLKGRDLTGTPIATSVTPFGDAGPSPAIPDNTWVEMKPGGIAQTAWNVGDEGYDSFLYDPGIKKALVWGDYHIGFGAREDQNALMAYDFTANRWDLLQAGEYAWSERLPGVGHDEGNVTIDPKHDLYITHGNLTTGTDALYRTYLYDLKAHRGKRMTPSNEIPGPHTDTMASAFDPDHDVMLAVGQSGGWLYDHNVNVWTAVPNGPGRETACLIYDATNHLFVLFAGMLSYAAPSMTETWVFDASTNVWTQRFPAQSPPSYTYPQEPMMAFDGKRGVSLLMGGNSQAVWVYDAAADTWTRLPDAPMGVPVDQVDSADLLYDADDDVFLVRHASDITNLWAFRYAP